MRWAYREELVHDISYLDRLPRAKEPTVREKDSLKYLEADELQRLLSGMSSSDWILLTRFLVLTGMRIGEAIALLASDVDLSGRNISITKSFSQITLRVSSTKTDASVRDVFVQDELLPVCREIFSRRRMLRKKYGVQTDLFFPSADGSFLQYSSYCKFFRENTETILGRRLTPHALRHTHVALLAENGIPLDVISRRLGHSDSAITRDVYMHVTQRLKEKDNDSIRSLSLLKAI